MDSIILTGYVNVTQRDSVPIWLGGDINAWVLEQVQPGAFEEAIEQREVPILLDHDPARQVGTSRSNFDFEEDKIGLRCLAGIVTDPYVIRKARTGTLRGWSFAFKTKQTACEPVRMSKRLIEVIGGKNIRLRRNILRMELLEISLIDDMKRPIYPGTLIEIARDLRGKSPKGMTLDSMISWLKTQRMIRNAEKLKITF